ncbi:diheme cytochrome c [Rhodobacter lacus]|uniref:Diheme cytochrome c n=1 Tax=Rhodobacter lacus TaxID=1641972 RepID=A0ABW5AA48_9RHOB
MTGITRAVLLLAAALAAAPACAEGWGEEEGEHHSRSRGAGAPADPAFLAECSACHMAFPPGFLPARSWQAMMADLGNHFGEDASLDTAPRDQIEAYLVANAADAGNGRRRDPAPGLTPLRISGLPWFVHEHGREVSAARKAKAGSMSNCTACHRGAAQGYFEDD